MKKMVYGALAALTLLSAGCTGSFQLVQGIHTWHTGFASRWVDEMCYIFPGLILYVLAGTVDTFGFNPIEFWMGQNPVQMQTNNLTIDRLDSTTALVRNNETGATYTVTRNADNTLTMKDANGNFVTAEVQGSLLKMTASDGTTRAALR